MTRHAVLPLAAGSSSTLTLAHINDTHGRYRPVAVSPGNATAQTGDPGREEESFSRVGKVGGYAVLAAALRQLRERVGAENVLLLHGGDAFGDDLLANLTQGEATIQLVNALGFQFLALGNHDFDYGAKRTRELQGIAQFPMRSANVTDASGNPFFGEPAQVFRVAGARVAVLALGYHNTDQTGSRAKPDRGRRSRSTASRHGEGTATRQRHAHQVACLVTATPCTSKDSHDRTPSHLH